MGAAPSVAHTAGNSGAGDLQQHASANFAPSDEEVRQRRKELGLDDDPSPAAPIVPAPHLASPFSSFQKRRIRLFSGGSVGTWRKGPVIGKGATGAVYEAIDDATQGVFAVKEIQFAEDFADNPEDRRRFDALRAEVSLLQQVEHPNVVRFLGIDRVGFNMYIMMEFVAGGNVQSLVKRFKRLPEELAAKYAFQIVAGLTYLHAKNIIHRDIKGANILVSDDGILKLADFGAAKKIMDPEQLQHTLAGTPYWMAPEVVRQEGHGKPADVWSLGGTVLQMLTGKAPYQDLPPVAALFKIGHGTELPIPSDAVLSPLARDFVAQCLERDAARRPPVEALIEHPWLRNAKVALQPYYAAATAPTSPLGGVFSSGHASETASLQSSYRGVPPKEESPGGATQVAAEHPVSLEEGLVMEYVIALSFTHDDDAALAAVLAAQQSQAVFIEPSATRAVRFDGDLSTGGGGRAGGHDEEEVYLDGEFNQDQFDAFVGALGKDDASQ